jgi:5'-nucleotidase/UDP-sugar diphosphatase
MSRIGSCWLLGLCMALALCGHAVPVRILATGDMNGWLKGRPMDGFQIGGAAAMLAAWKQREEYAPGKYLVLSSGDNITGPALSNLLEGEPDIEVMNALGFQASALGNHEFDYGRGQLLRLAHQATFPFLAANLTNPDGTPAEMVKPYALIETQGVKVGVIGLVNRTLPSLVNIGILKVGPHVEALRRYVPEVRAKGAQVVIVISHIPMAELAALANAVPDLRIPLMLGGYSHELNQQCVADGSTWVMNNGDRWAAYGRIDLEVDLQDGSARVEGIKQVRLQQRPPTADSAVQAIIDRWQQRLGPDFTRPMGTTNAGLLRSTTACAFTLHAWLLADQVSDFAMVNMGGIRQDLAAGPFTKADVINMLPFDDKLYRVKMTGKQLMAFRGPKGDGVGISGLTLVDGKLMWTRANQPIDEKTVYKIITIDYLYNTSEDLRAADPNPAVVSPDWRIPLYKWLDEHQTSKTRPAEKEMALEKVLVVTEAGIK